MLFACRINRFLRPFSAASPHICSNIINSAAAARIIRPISSSVLRLHPKNEHPKGQGRGREQASVSKDADRGQEGKFSRTDDQVQITRPDENHMPRSVPGVGRSGSHLKRTLPSFSLDGRVAVMTGGARGLGLVMAQALIVSGADVAIVDLNKEEAARQAKILVDLFREENPDADKTPKVTAHYADVANSESVDQSIREIIAEHGKIDHLVTSAGFTENFSAITYPVDRVQKLMDVNFLGTYIYATAVARHLMERKAKGSMVLIGSMSGIIVNVPQPQAPYNASKAAVRHLAASLAVEWADAGIRVNVISPGYMMTPLTKKILDDKPDLSKRWTSLIPQGKMGQPEDLMGAVVFLLSDASSYVTGADLRVDGGYTVT